MLVSSNWLSPLISPYSTSDIISHILLCSLILHCSAVLLRTSNVASVTEWYIFLFYLILVHSNSYLESHICLVAAVLDNVSVLNHILPHTLFFHPNRKVKHNIFMLLFKFPQYLAQSYVYVVFVGTWWLCLYFKRS